MRKYYDLLLSEKIRDQSERVIIWISILSFLIHLLIIGVINLGVVNAPIESELLTNPISAIYTPFTFILLFEVYLLVYHIPLSTSDYIAKQYEIITLIVIRRIFKDLANTFCIFWNFNFHQMVTSPLWFKWGINIMCNIKNKGSRSWAWVYINCN